MIDRAVILAASEGRRLWPFTVNRPKSMLLIAGKPIIEYIIRALAQNGIREIILVVGYRREQIYDYFGSGDNLGVKITYITQNQQLGTAQALLQTSGYLDGNFLVLSGDKYICAETISGLLDIEPPAVLVKRMENPLRESITKVDAGRIVEPMLLERRSSSTLREAGMFTINTRIYAFNNDVFNFLGVHANIPEMLEEMVRHGHVIRAVETEGDWQDVLYPWDILSLNGTLLNLAQPITAGFIETGVNLKGRVVIGEGTIIRSGCYIQGPVLIGKGCVIGPSVWLRQSTSIGDNVAIEPFSLIENSVIGNDVRIGAGANIDSSVIDCGCVIAGHFSTVSTETEIKVGDEYHRVQVGVMMGSDCQLGANVVAQPGVMLGNSSMVSPLKTLRGILPVKSLVV
jgi:UDP-N-acetylglucosamine diphosphorylase/glucosamine-1-phosphate N-acetyltransferase